MPRLKIALLILITLYAAAVTVRTRPNAGAGDPLYYVHAANTLLAGQGLRNFPDAPPETIAVSGEPNAPFTAWTPGYPVALAISMQITRQNVVAAAWLLNAAALAIMVVAAYGLARDLDLPTPVSVAIATSTALHMPTLGIYTNVLTDGIFATLTVLWMRAALRADRHWLALALLSAALFAFRYTGILFVGLGALAVGVQTTGDGWRKLVRVSQYALVPTIAIWAWMVRSAVLTGTINAGPRPPGTYASLAWAAERSASVIGAWLPNILIIGGGVLCAWFFLRMWRRSTSSP